MMNWFRDLSKELRIWLGVGIGVALATTITIAVATVLKEKDKAEEQRIANERTQKAIAVVIDSIRIEFKPVIANQDTLKQLFRNFVWVIGAFTLKGAI